MSRNKFLMACVAVASASTSLFGAVFYCSPDGKSSGEGGDGTLSHPYTLAEAYAKSALDDEIRLIESDEHYVLGADFEIGRRMVVGWNGATDQPAGRVGRSRVVIDGDEKYGVKCAASGSHRYGATYRDLTITRGQNKTSVGRGGLFYVTDPNDPLVFSNVVFTGVCKQWWPIYITVRDESQVDRVKFVDCDFSALTCGYIGDGFMCMTGVKFDGCRFSNVTNTYANCVGSLGTFTRCSVTNCVFSDSKYSGNGAILSKNSIFSDCVFTNNIGGKYGSCFVLTTNGVALAGCRFYDNSAGEYGGCFYGGYRGSGTSTDTAAAGRLYATNCVFVGNSCTRKGGVFAVRSRGSGRDDDWRFVGCAFTNNVATDKKEGSCLYLAATNTSVTALVKACDFCRNGSGACVNPCDSANVLVDGCSFTGNVSAVSHSFREDVGYYFCKIDLRNSDFVDNAATVSGMGTVSNCLFRSCPGVAVNFFAGGLYDAAYETNLIDNHLHDCRFEDNGDYCVRQTYGKFEATGCVFTNNHNICLYLSTDSSTTRSYYYQADVRELKVERCRFVGNVSAFDYHSKGNGGTAILHFATDSTSGYVRNCLFLANTNTVNCKGVEAGVVQVGANTVVDACTFVDNHSQNGVSQALAIWGDKFEGRVRNCVFQNNTGALSLNSSYGYAFASSAPKAYYNCFDTYGWLRKNALAHDGNARGNIGGSWTSTTVNAPMDAGFATADCQLAMNSPLVDAGINDTWMAGVSDFRENARKFPRIFNKTVDIGCWELCYPLGMILLVR